MEWVQRSPQMHTTFGNLGFSLGDGYHINENCSSTLETILHNILLEDKYLRNYRRSISFGQNINKDLIPLLLHAKDDKLLELLIKIFVNLTVPIECLLSVEVISKTDFGRHTIFEINNLLSTTKAAFTDNRATKVIIEYLKKHLGGEQKGLTVEQCTNISNSLLLLRNILHIPEEPGNSTSAGYSNSHTVQNQILWNIFSQSIDKILIKLIVVPEAPNWGVTIVQLIALLYKDQHVVTLHKLLNLWLEASLSESSEDNESNTSPPDRDSSLKLTSDPTSDSSDTGGSGNSNDDPNSVTNGWEASPINKASRNSNTQLFQPPQLTEKQVEVADTGKGDSVDTSNDETSKSEDNGNKDQSCNNDMHLIPTQDTTLNNNKKTAISENSDYGYGTQIENQGSISTSSNEDESPSKKPVHQKPHKPKQRANPKVRTGISTLHEKKRKKLVKRGKSNIINVQGLSHKTPTDDDISNILKEFTVDFLLKGYNHIVQTLHTQILSNEQLEIDISHFLWLVTYFLKFATQIELDLEHICKVLSYDVISFLTAEGVNLCEQFELAIKLDGNDLKPSIRRLHLVVTAIREFVQAIEGYKKFAHVCSDDKEALVVLQVKMCETEELRSLLVLLLRNYNPEYHSKQYLQDLVVTNHILLIFFDSVMKLPDYHGTTSMSDHIKQFATPEIMYQYGLLLEEYISNGEFVNDCIFTLMHHVGGELGCLNTLFQPKILKCFTTIWKSEFEICDDWSDLIEYVINTFIKKPNNTQSSAKIFIDNDNASFDENKVFFKPLVTTPSTVLSKPDEPIQPESERKQITCNNNGTDSPKERWTEDELSSLSWKYMQSSASTDVVGEIIKAFKEDGISKTRDTVVRELYKQKLINKDEFETASKGEGEKNAKKFKAAKEMRDDEISKYCEQLIHDGKSKFLDWVQQVLLETCFAKIYLEKKTAECEASQQVKLLTFELFKEKAVDVPVMSPVSYHSLIYNQSVPLVPWNCEQAAVCKDLKFLQLLHKLGFHMPVDTGKVFIRIPHFWTAECLYEIAGKVAHIDVSKLKFSLSDISRTNSEHLETYMLPSPAFVKDINLMSNPDTLYQIHKQKHMTMMSYTPMPGSPFITDGDKINQQNWLQLVQKAQECKLAITLKSSMTEKDEDAMSATSQQAVGAPPMLGAPVHSSFHLAGTTAKHDSLPEPECNNSLCETASVASDLTRMYVSDEDEKTEVMLLQPLDNQDYLVMAEEPDHDHSTDSDNIAEKRPRVQ